MTFEFVINIPGRTSECAVGAAIGPLPATSLPGRGGKAGNDRRTEPQSQWEK
jgi:hypothetical protein